MRLSSTCVALLVSIVANNVYVIGATDQQIDNPKEVQEYDIVIYGATSAGIVAAVQAKKMGKTVVVVGPDKHLGGLTSGGLGWTDSGRKEVIGGLSREFYQRVKKHYDKPHAWRQQRPEEYSRYRRNDDAMWVFEPHVAEATFEQLVAEYQIPVHRDEWLDRRQGGVSLHRTLSGDSAGHQIKRVEKIRMLSGKIYLGKIFMDCTYEGDLMAAAGVSYHVGREANSVYGETLNGVQKAHARSHQFRHKISPYVVAGDPSSGLLPRVHDEDPGQDGQGDSRLQAYNYRICMTNAPQNRIPFPKPEGYDAKQYELLLRSLLAGSRHVFGKIDPAPNLKTDTNNHGCFSTDNIGMNYDYPEASYERRAEILHEHRTYQQGYHWFLCNDPRVPAEVRQRYSEWGLPKDEFVDSGHWPHQIYVREARRMVSDFVMAEPHLRGQKPTPKPIGMGSYNMDSHNTQRYVERDEDGVAYVRNEGDIQVNPGGPYPISYDAIVPKKQDCQNLLVPVCVSSSHIAFGSIRMEPVFMVLGQSAATAACLAIDQEIAVQEVPYASLRSRLLEDGQVLEWHGPRKSVASIDATKLEGVVVDDTQVRQLNRWAPSRSVGGFVGSGYLADDGKGSGKFVAEYTARLPQTGKYSLRMYHVPHSNRATNVPVAIKCGSDEHQRLVNQRITDKDQKYTTLGDFEFADETVKVTISNNDCDGHVIIDAIQLVPTK